MDQMPYRARSLPVLSLAPLVGLFLAATLVVPAPVRAQSAQNVLLVINDASQASVRVGEYYARKRAIAQDDIVHLNVAPKDQVDRGEFERLIQAPLVRWFGRRNAHDRILYIVLTKGVPLRVAGTSDRNGTVASVDSELTLLYRRMTGVPVAVNGPITNPYFLAEGQISQAKPFSHQDQDIYLVTRLDGYTVDDVIGLIDRGAAPVAGGRVLLDEKASWTDKGNEWLKQSAEWLNANGFADRVTLETTSRVLANEPDVIGYYSWGSNDPSMKQRHLGLKFLPGAIAGQFVSSDARTFEEPPATWTLGDWANSKTFFAGSPQSLAGDLIRDGVTGVAGHVAEPYLDATIRPNVLFPAYVSGFNLAEAYYLAMPYLSWQTVVIGDPLCAPFAAKRKTAAVTTAALDSATDLPAQFSRRRMREVAGQVPNAEAAVLMLKAEGQLARDDKTGATTTLEKASGLDPRAVPIHMVLASVYEEVKAYDKAIDLYRRVIAIQGDNVGALNNLAYALACRKNQAPAALPLAEKAYVLSRGNPVIADTLGWVYHLSGDDAKAGALLGQASRGAPENGEIRLHLAVVLAVRGMLERAEKELATALVMDPSLESRDEVKDLRARLKAPRK